MANIDYSGRSVLIIEQTESFRALLKKMLTDMGAGEVVATSSGKEAVENCANHDYHIIVCDYDLGPGKTGLHVLEELRLNGSIAPSTVFVMLTATVDKSIVLSCLEHKPSAFISKPFNFNDLKSRLDKILNLQDSLSHINHAIDKKKSRIIETVIVRKK